MQRRLEEEEMDEEGQSMVNAHEEGQKKTGWVSGRKALV